MTVRDIPLTTLAGQPTSLGDVPGTLLVVNVASKCGLTPQYEGLERLHEAYRDRGFSVVGFPCNQFGGQEPGTADEIATFCSSSSFITRAAQSGSGTPSERLAAMRGPPTSSEKLPLPMTTTRSGAGHDAMARPTAWPSA